MYDLFSKWKNGFLFSGEKLFPIFFAVSPCQNAVDHPALGMAAARVGGEGQEAVACGWGNIGFNDRVFDAVLEEFLLQTTLLNIQTVDDLGYVGFLDRKMS